MMSSPYAGLFLTPGRLDGLAAGALVAFMQPRMSQLLRTLARKATWIAGGGLVLVYGVVTLLYFSGRKELGIPIWITLVPFFASICFAAVVARLAMNAEDKNPRWLVSPVLTSVARYSYGMYALHVPIITWLFYQKLIVQRFPVAGFDLPYRIYFFILIAGLSYAVGLISWHLYEKQLLKLAPRYRYSRKAQVPTPTAQVGVMPVP
jgi:peptidoglycan/LPS O-acetylase OafA/YrhL